MKKLLLLTVSILSFFMIDAQVQVPVLTQDFEGGSIPTGWTTVDNDNDAHNWKHSSSNYGFSGHNSSGCVFSESYDDDSWAILYPDNWLILPAVSLTGNSTLTFWVMTVDSEYPNEHYGVYVSTSSASDLTSFTQVYEETLTENNDSWGQRSVSLDAYAGNTVYIAFRHFNCNNQYILALDDISVLTTSATAVLTVSPAAIDFGTLPVGSPSVAQQVTVNAFNNTAPITAATTAPFEISTDNTTFGTSATLPDTGGLLYVRYTPSAVGSASATVTITSGSLSETVTLSGNGIDCSFITIPLVESFESEELNSCWSAFAADPGNSNPMGVNDDVASDGTQSFGFSSMYSSSNPHQYLITPELPASGTKMVSFDYLAYYGIYYPETFRVGYSTTTNDPSAFTWGNNITSTSGSWENFLDITVPGNVKYVAIDYFTAQGAFFFVDNFSVQAAPACMAPTNLSASNITTHSASLSWDQSDDGLDITLFYVTNSDTNVQVVTSIFLTDGYYVFENLSSSTTYTWMLGVICDGDTLLSEASTFTTPCDAISQLPYSQDFNSEETYSVPSCWTQLNATSAGYPMVSTLYAHSGKALEFRCGYLTGTPSYILLPQFTTDLSNLQLTFWTRRESASSGTLTIGYMSSISDTSTFVPVASYSSETLGDNNYHFYTVMFSDVNTTPDADYHIAFRYSSTHNYYWFVDDVVVDEIPDCMVPYDLVVNDVTAHTAHVSWTGNTDSYQLYYKASADTGWTVLDNVTLTSSGYTVDGLEATTTYTWKVAAICDDGTLSESLTTSTFTTGCGIYVAPYEQTFGSAALPLCWEKLTGSPDAPPVSTESGWGFANTNIFGQYHATLNLTASAHYWLVSPEISLNELISPTLIFEMALTGHNNSNPVDSSATSGDRFLVMVSTDNGASWNPGNATVWSNETSGDYSFSHISASGEMISLSLDDYSSETVRIAFYGEAGSGSGSIDLHIDNVRVDDAPACLNPSQLVISNVTNSSASLSWTENGTASSWLVQYGPEGFQPDDANTLVILDTPATTLSNLQQNTTYQVLIYAACPEGTYSSPVEGYFTTTLTPTALPYSTDFSTTSDLNWRLNNGTCTNHWTMGTVDGNPALYITNNDSLQPAAYKLTTTSVVSAEKALIVGTANEIMISFDVKIGGESYFDFLKLFLATDTMEYPANTNYSSVQFAYASYYKFAYDFTDYLPYSTYHNYPYKFNLTGNNTVHIDAVMPNPNLNPNAGSIAKLVFLWRNDYMSGVQPGAIISNLTVKEASCAKPVSLIANNVTANSATLDWTVGGGETAWNVEYRETTADAWTVVPVTTNSCPISGLAATTTYLARVQANCGEGDLSPYITISFTTDSSGVVNPTEPTVSTNPTETVQHTYAVLSGTISNPDNVTITSQGFEWKAANDNTYTQVTCPAYGNDFTYTLSNLTSNTNYSYKAFITYNGITAYGNELNFTTLEDICNPPTNFETSISDTAVHLHWNWEHGMEFFTEFQVFYRQQGTENWNTFSVFSNGCVLMLNDLVPDAQYEIYVVTVCDNGMTSVPSDIFAFHTPTTGISEWEEQQVTLSPNPAKDIVNVQITMHNIQSGDELQLFDVYGKLIQVVPVAGETTAINISNLANGIYFVRLTTAKGMVTKPFVKK